MSMAVALGAVMMFLAIALPASAALPVRNANVGDTRLAYVEQGHGEPIVLVHGGMQDYRVWEEHMSVLSKTHRVIAYSRRNHFPNPVSVDGWPDTAADLHADDLYRLISALHLGPVHLVAHSSGAFAALFFAAQHPELVRSLAVNEPPAGSLLIGTPDGAEVISTFNHRLEPSRAAFRGGDLASGVRLFTDAVSGPGAFETRSEANRQMLVNNAVAHQADAVSSTTPLPPESRPHRVESRRWARAGRRACVPTRGEQTFRTSGRVESESSGWRQKADRFDVG